MRRTDEDVEASILNNRQHQQEHQQGQNNYFFFLYSSLRTRHLAETIKATIDTGWESRRTMTKGKRKSKKATTPIKITTRTHREAKPQAKPAAGDPEDLGVFPEGCPVEIHSLKQQKWLNGTIGKITGPLGERQDGRYPVLLAPADYQSAVSRTYKTISVKTENLKKIKCLHGAVDFWGPYHTVFLDWQKEKKITIRLYGAIAPEIRYNEDLSRHFFAQAARHKQKMEHDESVDAMMAGFQFRRMFLRETTDNAGMLKFHNKLHKYMELMQTETGLATLLAKHTPSTCSCFDDETKEASKQTLMSRCGACWKSHAARDLQKCSRCKAIS
jgi:hypothetical protein